MSDAAPRRVNPWPILSLALLVVLLGTFLFVQWRKRDSGPAVIKDTPPAPEDPRPVPVGHGPDPGPKKPPAPVADARLKEFEARLAQARAAADQKKWDEAGKLAQEAEGLFPDGPGLKELRQRIVDERQAQAARAAEDRRKLDLALAEGMKKVERLRDNQLWDEALQTLEKLRQDHPPVAQMEDFQASLRRIREFRNEAQKLYDRYMKEAEQHLNSGTLPKALESAERAAQQYKERRALVKTFQDKVSQAMLQRDMVRIPAAACWVGSDNPEFPDEAPLREVKLPAFYIDKYEVTHEEYFAFLVATSRPTPARSPYWISGRPREGREKHPVVYVSYEDAEAYAAWAGKRLPTAEEWEVAARGPDRREYPWGNLFSEKENVFHCNCLEFWQLNKTLAPGTSRVDATDVPNDPSPFGVYGMGGNVWEWTSTPVSRKLNGKEAKYRVLKGGSFMTDKRAIRSSNLYPEDPSLGHPDVGFRCVREIK